MNCGTEAGGCIKVDDVANETTTLLHLWRSTDPNAKETIKHIDTHFQLKGVFWALLNGWRVRVGREGQVAQHKVQCKKESE